MVITTEVLQRAVQKHNLQPIDPEMSEAAAAAQVITEMYSSGIRLTRICSELEAKRPLVTAYLRSTDAMPILKQFYEDNQHWMPSEQHNLLFIRCQENWANDQLRARGHLFLNEVFDMLGMPRTQLGAKKGWLNGPVEFKIVDKADSGWLLIRFNLEGNVIDALPKS